MQNLLRIAILLLVGVVAMNIAKQSGFFGTGTQSAYAAEEPTQEEVLGGKAALEAGPQYV